MPTETGCWVCSHRPVCFVAHAVIDEWPLRYFLKDGEKNGVREWFKTVPDILGNLCKYYENQGGSDEHRGKASGQHSDPG